MISEVLNKMTQRQFGFTLLELLIAMTLMGIVLVLLYSGLRLSMRGWEAGEERAEGVNEMRLVQDFIRRQLKQSMVAYRNDPTQGRIVTFTGEPRRIVFVAPLLSHLGRGGLYLIRLEIVPADSGEQLLMRWRPYRPADENDSIMEETSLLDGISNIAWNYFGVLGNGQDQQPPQWYEQWQETARRPILVRLDLEVHGNRWPSLVAALVE